jgi:hypothetical protein
MVTLGRYARALGARMRIMSDCGNDLRQIAWVVVTAGLLQTVPGASVAATRRPPWWLPGSHGVVPPAHERSCESGPNSSTLCVHTA